MSDRIEQTMIPSLDIDTKNRESEFNQLAKQNFLRWNEALHTHDPAIVAKLYFENATFLPTLNPEFKQGQVGAQEYFHHFLEKNPDGRIVKEVVQVLGENCYLHSGMYNFEVGPEDNRQVAEARFSYVWEKDDKGEWKIIHHHSSLKPKE